jgi:MATE family multidrug resistance protein
LSSLSFSGGFQPLEPSSIVVRDYANVSTTDDDHSNPARVEPALQNIDLDEVDDSQAAGTVKPWRREMKVLLNLSGPMILSYLFSTMISVVSLTFVGRLGKAELGGAALGNMWCNVTGYSLGIGLLTARSALIFSSRPFLFSFDDLISVLRL